MSVRKLYFLPDQWMDFILLLLGGFCFVLFFGNIHWLVRLRLSAPPGSLSGHSPAQLCCIICICSAKLVTTIQWYEVLGIHKIQGLSLDTNLCAHCRLSSTSCQLLLYNKNNYMTGSLPEFCWNFRLLSWINPLHQRLKLMPWQSIQNTKIKWCI